MVGNFLAILRLFLLVICGCSWLNAQTVITGTVTDGTETLIGVAVREKGRDGGTLTDLDGRYDLSVSGPEAILVFTYVGKESQEITVGKRTEIDVVLRGTTALEQVVVTGYRGAQEVKDLVGSYAEVTETDLVADRPVESLDQLLGGRIAGVRVETVTGEPGLPIRVQIRGQGSLPDVNGNITASTQPLFVLDGVPLFDVSETTNNQASLFSSFNNQPLNPLALINADDIASITVLKDASATALYGADAANGVVLITTKTGAAGDQSISLSANFGTGQTINEIQFLDTRQYVELARETLFNSGQNPAESGSSTVETNWRNLVQRASTNADVDVAFSGGVAGVRYRVTAGYNELESVHRENGLRQGNLNLNLIFPVSDRFRITTRFSGAGQHKESLRSFEAFSFLPNVPVRLEDGSFNNDGFFARRPNPVALLEQNESYQDVFSTNAQLTLEYTPVNTVKLRLLGGIDQQARRQFQYDSALNGSGALANGRLRRTNANNLQWITNGQVSWRPQTSERHHFGSLLGGELQGQNNFTQVTTGSDFPFDDLRQLRSALQETIRAGETTFERTKASVYGEVSYDYDYRYYLKLNARRDASSIFGGDQQADLFWAVGTSWNFSEEPLLKDRLPFRITYGKLRGSYGITGNSRLGVYSAAGLYNQGFNDEEYGGQFPLLVETPNNDRLGWERKRQTNLGLDLGWRDRRYTLSLEYYSNLTVDGLYSFSTPYESGFSNLLANAATMRNWGYELSFRFRANPRARLRWTSSFNIARNRNRLIEISQPDLLPSNDRTALALIPGRDVNTLYGIPFAGVDSETGVALYRLPDGTITSERAEVRDRRNFVPLGRSTPDFFGGWQNGLTLGAWNLTLQLNYSYGATDRVDRLTFTDGQQILINNQSVNQLDRWQRPGDETGVPRLLIDNPPVARSSRYFFDLSYLQFASLSLNVDLGQLGVLPVGADNFRFFGLVNNLGYLYAGERVRGRNGIAEYRFTFPQQRSVTFGLKISW